MPVELVNLFDMIRENKKQRAGCCNGCPLWTDNGPARFECADVEPQVVVVSESPAREPKEACLTPTDIENWAQRILKEAHDNKDTEPQSARYMGHFIGGLTKGRVYRESDGSKTHGLYWTHTVKCFLQRGNIGIGKAKKDRRLEFECAIDRCAGYLDEEIARIDPVLIIAVGTSVAGRKLMASRFADRLCEVYHPRAIKKMAEKQEKLAALCRRVRDLGLVELLPACQ
jgi:uracil-DNA glycosylase